MKKIIVIIFILISAPVALHAEEWNYRYADNVTILYGNGLEYGAEETAALYPKIKAQLEESLGWHIYLKPTILLVGDHKYFLRMAGHPIVVGFAIPEKSLIVIDYTRMKTDPFSLESIIKHELCHLLLHEYIKSRNLPRWLDEGVAQWVSSGIADIFMADHSILNRAIVTGRYIKIKDLSSGFPEDNERLMLAYAESKSIVEYIISKYGTAGILRLLKYLREGHSIEDSVSNSFSISFAELEKNWYGYMKKQTTWVTLVINHLYEILFSLGAIILIGAYVKIYIRKRSYGDEEDDNDPSDMEETKGQTNNG